jgi:pilus assembly protein FimV
MKRVFKISSLLAFMLLVSGEVLAAGLGKMSVSSSLGQPLRAEIELLSVPPDELSTVDAKLADFEAYRQAHIDRSSVLPDLRFSIEKRANGQPVVRITSTVPIAEPFVDLLVELNWSSGRILREYTVLLDPATGQKTVDQATLPPVAATVSGAVAQPQSPAATPSKGVKQSSGEKNIPKGSGQEAQTYGPVKAGETLRSIAGKVVPADVSIDMMMASLYHANKGAFAKNNMNLLRKGQTLTVPDRDSVMRMYSPHQARQLIQEQTDAWHEIQNRLANQAGTPSAPPVKEKSAESGKIVQAQPQGKPPAPAESKDVLKLSKGQPAKASADVSKRVQDLQDEVTAKNRELQDAQSRVGQLEKTVQDLQRLVDMKAKQTGQSAEPTASQPVAPPPVAATPEVKPAIKAPMPPPPVQEEPGFFSSLLASPLYVIGIIAALILAGLLWVFMVGSRRRKGLSNFEQSIMTGGDQFKTSIFKTTTPDSKADRSVISQSGATTDFSRLGLGSIDTHEVDPIAEAEVYMAYGRDAQAEEILKEALAKEPQRHEIALKLLEIYSTRQDRASFETQASELYANLGDPTNTLWQRAAEMGRALDPTNPLYRAYGETPELPDVAAKAPEATHDAMAAVASAGALGTIEQLAQFEAHQEPAAEAKPVPAEADAHGLDLDFSPHTELAPAMEQTEPVAESEVQDTGLDFHAKEIAELPAFHSGSELEAASKEFPSFGSVTEPDLAAMEEINIAAPTALPEDAPVDEQLEELGDLDLTPESLGMSSWNAPSTPAAQEPKTEPAAAHDEPVQLPDLDFSGIDLEMNDTPEAQVAPAVAPATAEIEMPAIDPDLLEEVNTKLDLAKAYLEMGDKEGAREILSEVLNEGDAKQKQTANELMAEIG